MAKATKERKSETQGEKFFWKREKKKTGLTNQPYFSPKYDFYCSSLREIFVSASSMIVEEKLLF